MISLPSPLHYDVKMPNFTFCGERKQRTTKFSFSFCRNMVAVLRNSTPGEFAYIWKSKWLGEITMKIERTRILFLSDVFAAAAVLRSLAMGNFQHCWSNDVGICCVHVCSSAQTDATTPNNTQQGVQTDATFNIQQCCVRLHGPLPPQYNHTPNHSTRNASMRCNLFRKQFNHRSQILKKEIK